MESASPGERRSQTTTLFGEANNWNLTQTLSLDKQIQHLCQLLHHQSQEMDEKNQTLGTFLNKLKNEIDQANDRGISGSIEKAIRKQDKISTLWKEIHSGQLLTDKQIFSIHEKLGKIVKESLSVGVELDSIKVFVEWHSWGWKKKKIAKLIQSAQETYQFIHVSMEQNSTTLSNQVHALNEARQCEKKIKDRMKMFKAMDTENSAHQKETDEAFKQHQIANSKLGNKISKLSKNVNKLNGKLRDKKTELKEKDKAIENNERAIRQQNATISQLRSQTKKQIQEEARRERTRKEQRLEEIRRSLLQENDEITVANKKLEKKFARAEKENKKLIIENTELKKRSEKLEKELEAGIEHTSLLEHFLYKVRKKFTKSKKTESSDAESIRTMSRSSYESESDAESIPTMSQSSYESESDRASEAESD